MKEIYIKCPKCDLNYITKKEKICSVCKQKMASVAVNLLDTEKVAELGLCPICKVNYVTEDETVCSTCYADTDLSDEEISALYGDKPDNNDEADDDGLTPIDDDEMDLPEDEDLALLNVAGIDNEDGAAEEDEEDEESDVIDDPLSDMDDELDDEDDEEYDEDEDDEEEED